MEYLDRKQIYKKLQNIFAMLDNTDQDEKLKKAIAKWLNDEQHRKPLNINLCGCPKRAKK